MWGALRVGSWVGTWITVARMRDELRRLLWSLQGSIITRWELLSRNPKTIKIMEKRRPVRQSLATRQCKLQVGERKLWRGLEEEDRGWRRRGGGGGVCGLPPNLLSLLSPPRYCSSGAGTYTQARCHQTGALSSVRVQGNACLSKEPWGRPPQHTTARRWRRGSGPAIEFSTERFQWCASETWIFVHQSVGPTVRQSLVGVRGGADHFLYLG